jgi:hypothetical protein
MFSRSLAEIAIGKKLRPNGFVVYTSSCICNTLLHVVRRISLICSKFKHCEYTIVLFLKKKTMLFVIQQDLRGSFFFKRGLARIALYFTTDEIQLFQVFALWVHKADRHCPTILKYKTHKLSQMSNPAKFNQIFANMRIYNI